MTDYVRQVVISFEGEDNTAAATASVEANYNYAGQAAQSFGKKSEESSSRHEFATRRTVSALHMLGTAIGGNIGQAVQYAGSITQIVAATNPWVAGITAATLGIQLMGSLIKFLSADYEKLKKDIDETKKSMDALIEIMDKANLTRTMEMGGYTEYMKKKIEVERESAKGQERQLEIEKEIKSMGAAGGPGGVLEVRSKDLQAEKNELIKKERELRDELAEIVTLEVGEKQKALHLATAALEEQVLESKIEAKIKAEAAAEAKFKARIGTGMGPGGGAGGMFEYGAGQALLAMQLEQTQQQAFEEETIHQLSIDRKKEIDIEYLSFREQHMKQMVEIEKTRAQEDLRTNEEYQRAKLAQIQGYGAVVKNVLGVLNVAAEMGIKNEKARHAVQVALNLVDAGIKSAMEFAAGWATLMNPVESIGHFTAAALYAAVGIGKAVGGGGGGGGGGSSYDRSTAQGGTAEDRGPQKSEVTIYINGERAGSAGFGKVVVDSIDAHLDRQNPGRQRKQVTP